MVIYSATLPRGKGVDYLNIFFSPRKFIKKWPNKVCQLYPRKICGRAKFNISELIIRKMYCFKLSAIQHTISALPVSKISTVKYSISNIKLLLS